MKHRLKHRCLAALTLAFCCSATPVFAEDPEHVTRLLETRACFNCDLSGANLQGEHLIGADLRLADLSGANLSFINLEGADLTGANLREADLSQAYLTDVALNAAQFSPDSLSEENLHGHSFAREEKPFDFFEFLSP